MSVEPLSKWLHSARSAARWLKNDFEGIRIIQEDSQLKDLVCFIIHSGGYSSLSAILSYLHCSIGKFAADWFCVHSRAGKAYPSRNAVVITVFLGCYDPAVRSSRRCCYLLTTEESPAHRGVFRKFPRAFGKFPRAFSNSSRAFSYKYAISIQKHPQSHSKSSSKSPETFQLEHFHQNVH